jgi:hypothetical protein
LLQPVSIPATDKVQLLPVDPLPTTGDAVPQKILPKRPGYNKRGQINSIVNNQIVINDILRKLNQSTEVYSSSNTASSRRILTPGKWVEYKLDTTNTIIKIRIIDQ